MEAPSSELSSPGAVELLKQVRMRDGFLQVEKRASNSQEETGKSCFVAVGFWWVFFLLSHSTTSIKRKRHSEVEKEEAKECK